ncbi:transporter [Helicobacter sp. 13S00401-1]|uniref:GntP family permease n=1 Tax=Helicobacter sp. 13S00401-1 TaxID=1905758 RepID=UPI000BA5DA4B|nr:GntP family permease [Helicobacter sp. 13S00401-1]PAF51807.1 transporter [Helicobacter sp. 13S00401-1]
MGFIIVLLALCCLMYMAYKGFSVIIFAPLIAMAAVLLVSPSLVAPMFTGLFMPKLAGFVQAYFPVFLLGAIFGKVIELSGFSKSIASWVIKIVGKERAMLSIVIVCLLLTYGGISLFVVVFAVYPFAVELFRKGDIPKRLIPGTIALGAFTATMDAIPGTPQIQNIIPTTFFGTNIYAAPILGTIGAIFIIVLGMLYLEWRRRVALRKGEGYGSNHKNEPPKIDETHLANPLIAILPLIAVGVINLILTKIIPSLYEKEVSFASTAMKHAKGIMDVIQKIQSVQALWAVEAALLVGIIVVFIFAWKKVIKGFSEGAHQAVGGSLIASLNTATEYGFGAVIAALPGFLVISHALSHIPNPLVNEAITVTALAGITGSASGGLGIALAAMADTFIAHAHATGIPLEVFHRIASMASGGMDTLPHNGAVITLLAVTGLSHKQSYKDIFAITILKTVAVFFVIGVFYVTGLV